MSELLVITLALLGSFFGCLGVLVFVLSRHEHERMMLYQIALNRNPAEVFSPQEEPQEAPQEDPLIELDQINETDLEEGQDAT
jgi:hypothetical protein